MEIFEILKAILFGIVEGITEWLPISSTGHMILLDEFVKLNVTDSFWDMFLVVIQLGAILAVIVLFWNLIWPFTTTKKAEMTTNKYSIHQSGIWIKPQIKRHASQLQESGKMLIKLPCFGCEITRLCSLL